MKKLPFLFVMAALSATLAATPALAWHIEGRVYCQGTALPLPGVGIQVVSTSGPSFSGAAVSGPDGEYFIALPDDPRCYQASLVLGANESPVTPPSGTFSFCTTQQTFEFTQNWVVSSPRCEGACWLTAGGVKFEPVTKELAGEHGPNDTWGGNVNPGCSPTAGDGGNWNHVAHKAKLHFQGRSITVLKCGNVDGIPPGSTSPKTPFNYIRFTGRGTLKGIQGNKYEKTDVYFLGYVEDRNEPGGKGAKIGALMDRYFLNVYSDPSNPVASSLLLIDVDGNPATEDPVTITSGNMQLHTSSCDATVAARASASTARTDFGPLPAAASGNEELSFRVGPNPTRDYSVIRYTLPRDGEATLAAFDVSGRKVIELASGLQSQGEHAITWNLRDSEGRRVSNGVYFLRFRSGGVTTSRVVVVSP